MFDVSPKFHTLRYARAKGYLISSSETMQRVMEKSVPKGDVCEVARAAGIAAAKKCSEWIIFCHPIPLDWVEVDFAIEKDRLKATAQVRSIWKTGVEVEAITAVSCALLNAYDMLKPLDQNLRLSDISVVEKKGGKGDFQDTFQSPLKAAILVISDSTFAGTRKDKSGLIIKEFLQNQPMSIAHYEILPDKQEQISSRLRELAKQGIRLIFTTGGTGLGPRDVTPEATLAVIERSVPGICETIRHHGKQRTPYAMLSRGEAGLCGDCLIINLPGSSNGARESLAALFPGLLHIFSMMAGKGHGKKENK